jgi:hypothetical protein
MKIILSRKGFDSTTGGCASPIFPNGTLFSLPIPNNDDLKYDKLKLFGKEGDVCSLIESLNGKYDNTSGVHLDPDIRADIVDRRSKFIGAFGQSHAALSHLEKNNVDIGDIFLFFGWFREVEDNNGKWKFKKDAKDKHIIFGYLQIGEIISSSNMGNSKTINKFSSLKKHPHYIKRNDKEYGDNNCIYVASEGNLKINGKDFGVPSFGTFEKQHELLVLTKSNQDKRSLWELPNCFNHGNFTYHKNQTRWKKENDKVILNSVGRGQEFVVETNPEILNRFVEPIFNYYKIVITPK